MRIVVVGASSGLGRCIATGMAERGAKVALLARRKDRIEDAARDAGPHAVAIACDVTNESSCELAIADATAPLSFTEADPLVAVARETVEAVARHFAPLDEELALP